jgi:hypothetical protein
MKLKRWDRPVGAMIGLLLCAGFTYQASQSAFAATPPAVDAASVLSVSSAGGSSTGGLASFTPPALLPGQTGDRCTAVVYRRHDAARLKLYANDLAATKGLGRLLSVRVEAGRLSAKGGGCATFTPSATVFNGPLDSFPTTLASAGAPIALAGTGDDVVAIRVSYTLASTATNAAQGGTARLKLSYGIQAA